MKPPTFSPTNRGSVRAFCLCAVTVSGVFTATGCRKAPPPPAPKSASGGVKLTPEQVSSRIRDLQANKTIPEAVKPEIIRSIQAQGQ